jgi:mRNA interferase RelE/StbE
VAKYSLEIKQSAKRKSMHSTTRIDRNILTPAGNPRPVGCKKLKGYKDQRRIRVGDRPVLYIIDDAVKLVTIMRIAHRREVYE